MLVCVVYSLSREQVAVLVMEAGPSLCDCNVSLSFDVSFSSLLGFVCHRLVRQVSVVKLILSTCVVVAVSGWLSYPLSSCFDVLAEHVAHLLLAL